MEVAEAMVEGVVATEQIRGAGGTGVGVPEAMGPHRSSRATLQHSKVGWAARFWYCGSQTAAVQAFHCNLSESTG